MLLTGALTAFLAAWNNVANLVPAFQRRYVPVNLAVSAALVAAARAGGLGWGQLGLGAGRLPMGLLVGAAGVGVVAVGLLLAPHIPVVHGLLHDARVRGLSSRALAHRVLVRIPLGTVVLEEVAFRGVLLAAVTQVTGSTWSGVVVSSAVFGLWHVTPTIKALELNAVAEGRLPRIAVLGAAVAFTAAAGALFCGLRLTSGSLLAPAMLHTAANSLGAMTAWRTQRREGPSAHAPKGRRGPTAPA